MRLAPLLLLAPLAACSLTLGDAEGNGIKPSGTGTTRSFAVAGFSKIDLTGADDVEVRVGPSFAVTATGPADQLDLLRIDKDGDTLEIGRKRSSGSWGGDHDPVTIRVSLPALSQASLSGSADMSVDRLTGGSFTGETSGSGTLKIASLATDAASLSIGGSGTIKAAGKVTSLDLDVTGSGELDARGLKASRAKVSVAGSGDVTATVDGPAEVSVSGTGDVDLGSRAQCKISKSGTGDVTCGG